jgi:hypothetical protein
LALLCAATAIRAPHRLPYFGNILYDLGLGPMNIRGNLLASGELWTPHGWGGLWWIPTVLGLASAAGLLSAALRWVLRPTEADKARRPAVWFLGIWAALSVVSLYHPWLPVRFDRYLLSALVPILVLVASAPGQVAQASTRVGAGSRAPGSRPNRGLYTLQWGLAALLLIFSLRAQHDYLAWNRARWAALNDLIAAGIPPEQIDGGYEFNGWYTSPRFIERFGADAFVSSGPKGWWVVDDTYAIGWRPRPGYVVRERIPYDSWLGSDPEMLVLERE